MDVPSKSTYRIQSLLSVEVLLARNFLTHASPPTIVFLGLVFSAAPSLTAQSISSDLQQAATLIEERKFEEAERQLQRFLKSNPDVGPGYRLLGVVYERQEKWPQAEQAFEKALQLSPSPDSKVLFELCRAKFALKKTQEAIELAARISAAEANNAAAHYSVGRLLRENSRPDAAAAELEKARALDPQNPAVTTELVLADLDLKRADEAEILLKSLLSKSSYNDLMEAGARFGEASQYAAAARAFEHAAELQTNSYDAHFNLAFALYHLGEFTRAQAVLNRLNRTEAESHADYHYLRGKVALALNQAQVAGEEYLQALKAQPGNESLCMDAGLLFFQHEDFWKSLGVFESCSQRLDDSVAVVTGLALAYFRLGKYNEAIGAFRRVLALKPDADAAREGLAFLLYVSGRAAEARQVIDERAAGARADYYLPYLRALVLLRLDARRNRAAALASLEDALRLNPKFAPAYFQRGKIWAEEGSAERALADFKTATRLDPTYAPPYYPMAQIYFKQGKKQEAEAARRRFAELTHEQEEKEQSRQVENRLFQSLQ